MRFLVFLCLQATLVLCTNLCTKDEAPPSASVYTCQQQASWGKCHESWMKGYCCKSCGGCACGASQKHAAAAPRIVSKSNHHAPAAGASTQVVLNGLNVAWHNWARDFGSLDVADATATLQYTASHGGNSLRWWVHCDGSNSPQKDGGHVVTGPGSRVVEDLKTLATLAQRHNIAIMVTLWSFDMTKSGGLDDIINDKSKTMSYINNALAPMANALKPFNNILWDIINEPEWSIREAGSGGSVSLVNMQRFVGLQAAYLRRATKHAVTVGSASLKWNSDASPAVGNWWSDRALTSASGDSLARLHFYSPHYYDWMSHQYDPADKAVSAWSMDKPTMVGEAPAKSDVHPQFVEDCFRNGFHGVLLWDYNEKDPDSMKPAFNREVAGNFMSSFQSQHPATTPYARLVQWLASLS